MGNTDPTIVTTSIKFSSSADEDPLQQEVNSYRGRVRLGDKNVAGARLEPRDVEGRAGQMIAGQPPNDPLLDRVGPVGTESGHEYRELCTSDAGGARSGSLQADSPSPLAGIPQADGQQRLYATMRAAGVGENCPAAP